MTLKELEDLQLAPEIVEAYTRINITKLHKWQKDCLSKPHTFNSKNLLFTAPTSAVLTASHKGLIIVPFVSIVCELTQKLQCLNLPNLKIYSFYGVEPTSMFEECDIAVCTIEKANSIVNRLVEEERLDTIGTIVVDELHLLGDADRGYILELLLTKVIIINNSIKIIGTSATLPNIATIAKWLDAYLYQTTFRPVPLVEYIKVSKTIYSKAGEIVRNLNVDAKVANSLGDPDFLIPLVYETIQHFHSVLIFCAKRMDCENTAKHIARLIEVPIDPMTAEELMSARRSLIQELMSAEAGVDPTLEKCIMKGIAYHHSGLTVAERDIVEKGYREGSILVFCATSTLASGVNLPSKRVIFRTPYLGRNFLTSQNYHQMKGRAGRFGQGTVGESVVMCKDALEYKRVRELLIAHPQILKSSLDTNGVGMTMIILEALASRLASTRPELYNYISHTLLVHQMFDSGAEMQECSSTALQFLLANKFLTQVSDRLELTIFGKATLTSGIKPEDAIFISLELQRAMKSLVLVNELHLIYLCSSLQPVTINWKTFFDLAQEWNEDFLLVSSAIGINLGYLSKAANGSRLDTKSDRYLVHARFYQSLIIYEFVKETSLHNIINIFDISRGEAQNLQSTTSTFCSMTRLFCKHMGWNQFAVLFESLQERVVFGVEAELLSLSKIKGMSRTKARGFYSSGFKSVKDIVNGDVEDVKGVVRLLFPQLGHAGVIKEAMSIITSAREYLEQL